LFVFQTRLTQVETLSTTTAAERDELVSYSEEVRKELLAMGNQKAEVQRQLDEATSAVAALEAGLAESSRGATVKEKQLQDQLAKVKELAATTLKELQDERSACTQARETIARNEERIADLDSQVEALQAKTRWAAEGHERALAAKDADIAEKEANSARAMAKAAKSQEAAEVFQLHHVVALI
jgi:sugar-specific transcriptional regulator TrmB